MKLKDAGLTKASGHVASRGDMVSAVAQQVGLNMKVALVKVFRHMTVEIQAHGQMDFKMDTEPRRTPTEEFSKVNGRVECAMVTVSVSQSRMVSLPWSTTK